MTQQLQKQVEETLNPSPGGVLIESPDHEVVGAVGISGDTGDNDEICALAGIEAVGLSAIPGLPVN